MKNPSIASNDTEVSGGQIENCVTLVAEATRKATGVALRDLAKRGVLTKRNIERVRARGDQVVAAVTALVKEQFAQIAENIVGLVKLISGAEALELDPTDGKETIAEAKATFNWGIYHYGCDERDTNAPSSQTGKTEVTVHEMIKDGTFAQIFGGMSDDLNSLCLTQPQIIQFVKKHRKWLRTEGYGTFFLFKVDSELFVAGVFVSGDGRLGVNVDRLSDDYVWGAEDRRRLVVPQLAPKS